MDVVGYNRLEVIGPGVRPCLGADFWWYPLTTRSSPAALWLTLPADSPWALDALCDGTAELMASVASVHDPEALRATVKAQLQTLQWRADRARSAVGVRLASLDDQPARLVSPVSTAACIDRLDVSAPDQPAHPDMLQAAWDEKPVSEHLFTERLRMPNGRGGWVHARLSLDYSGPHIEPGSLVTYALAWRRRRVPLPLWVDALAIDIAQRCRPSRLSLQLHLASADGGVAVSGWRTNHPQQPPAWARWVPA